MKILKIGLLLGGLLVGVFFVYAVVSFQSTSSKRKTLAEAWRQTTGVMPEELIAAHPKTEKNESAHRLEQLAAKLGIDEMGDGSRLARDYFAERGTGASDETEELPENIKKYLAIHQNDLDALYVFILQNPAPEWETDVSLGAEVPLPNLSFHDALHEIIALDILYLTKENQNRQALEAFEGSRKASDFFRERPEATLQMTNLLVSATQNYALRKMNDVPANWRERLATDNYRVLAAKVLEVEFASAYLSAEPENSTTSQKFAAHLNPFSRFNSALDTSEAIRETVAELQQRDFCSLDSNPNGEAKLAWWNRGGKIVFPAALKMWRNFPEMSYDVELTERVLRLKEFTRASPGADLPPELSRIKSALCDDSNWTVEKQPDGSHVISFSRVNDLIKDEETPLSYTVQARK